MRRQRALVRLIFIVRARVLGNLYAVIKYAMILRDDFRTRWQKRLHVGPKCWLLWRMLGRISSALVVKEML